MVLMSLDHCTRNEVSDSIVCEEDPEIASCL